jgi:transposase
MKRQSKRSKRKPKGRPKKRKKQRPAKGASKQPTPMMEHRDLTVEELKAIIERAARGPLSDEDRDTLSGAVDTLAWLTQELEAKGASIKRLRKMLFGASTEKTSQVVGADKDSAGDQDDASADEPEPSTSEDTDASDPPKPKRKGHGRNGAADYRGADKVKVPHGSLKRGDRCPSCQRGKVYPLPKPKTLLRVRGMAPLHATVYELERLRCNLCGEVFVAQAPAGMGGAKYDETAASMIGLLKYGCGLPFNRLERLERDLGIPLPAATQWEVVSDKASLLETAYQELIRQAAGGDVLHNDDTTMRILELEGLKNQDPQTDEGADPSSDVEPDNRTGVFTSGIVSTREGNQIALFFTGRKHAGENLEKVLAKRAEELGPPIQMSDMLSRNTTGDFETIVAGCMAHSRRRYVDVADNFPDEVRHVLEELKKVYKTDAAARKQKMSPDARLELHQRESGPVMESLEKWLAEQFAEKKVEPNSGLGEAMGFMQKHWQKLTLFLRVPGAPLDNNIVERALKKAILHRKNALFYKTQNGARVGDMYMSLIHTAELCHADPFDYLVALMRQHEEVAKDPAAWMPWNYKDALNRLTTAP